MLLAEARSCQSRYVSQQSWRARSRLWFPSENAWQQFHWETKPIFAHGYSESESLALNHYLSTLSLSQIQALFVWEKKNVYWYELFLFREPRRWGFALWHFLKNNAVHVLKALPSLWLDSHPCIRWNAASSTSAPFRCFHFQPRFSLSMMYWSTNRPCLFPVLHSTCCNLEQNAAGHHGGLELSFRLIC